MVWLKVELCRMLEEKRSATLRSVYMSSPVSQFFFFFSFSMYKVILNKAPEGTFTFFEYEIHASCRRKNLEIQPFMSKPRVDPKERNFQWVFLHVF